MEVFVGPTFTIDVPSSPPPSNQSDGRHLFLGPPKFFTGGSSEPESSSSIGTPDDSDNDEEVQSKLNLKGRNGLGSLDSLEDSLPIKFVPFSLLLFILFLGWSKFFIYLFN